MGNVQTVLGAVAPDSLGAVLAHEHLNPGTCWMRQVRQGVRADDPLAILTAELKELKAHGIDTVIDVTSMESIPRNLDLLRRVSEASGIQIIASTGFYKEPLLPAFVRDADIDAIAEHMVREITAGIGGSGVRAGVIGEVGTSKNQITPLEEKLLRASARAHLATGVPIFTHSTLATMGMEQVELFQSEGVKPHRVVIGHCDLTPDFGRIHALLQTGVFIGIDTIGKQRFHYVKPESRETGPYHSVLETYMVPDERRAALVKELVDAGRASQLLFSSDIGQDRWVYENPDTLGQWGYSYVSERFCPDLKRLGVPGATITAVLTSNPRRLFE